ncbi:MAG TPA: sigma-54 dependent transcriptional regulator [Haliangium sp.]|nr:sigma-54 dependent transcriptional regulator [Haliangium sp.]
MRPTTDSRHAGLRALVIDDDTNIRASLQMFLEDIGCTVTAVGSADEALEAVEREAFDLAFLDVRLGDRSGIDVLPDLLAIRARLAVVVITAYAAFETAVQAIKRGAVDYLSKPFTRAQIVHLVEELAARRSMTLRLAELEIKLSQEVPEADFTTDSPRMQATLDRVARAAVSDAPVLLRGESGTGKGVLARALHAQSPRGRAPFVTVNCPTLPEDLLASELFGHARGAFPGAVREQSGRVEAAEGGTLFLDEIGEVPPRIQARLLRVLQERAFERVGETRTRGANVRVIAATSRNLERDVASGRFREDLLSRINAVEIMVPPLRERPEDILRMAIGFLGFFARAAGRRPMELSDDARDALLAHSWPGNVRDLRNAIERAVILWPAQLVTSEALPARIAAHRRALPRLGGNFTLEQIEREHIRQVMQRAPSPEDAARILGLDDATLQHEREGYEA